MYIDLIVFVILIILVIYFFRRFSSFVYLVCAVDILFRLLHFLGDNLKLEDVNALIDKYIPTDVIGMISNYFGTNGILYTIILWAMFILYCILLFYIVRILFRRK